MINKYKVLLDKLNEKQQNFQETIEINELNSNSKILIVDSLNTYIRSFTTCPVVNEDGIHVGGIVGFFLSVGYAIKMLNPTRVIMVFDGKNGSVRRRKIYPEYKNRRRSKRIVRKDFDYTIGNIEDEEKLQKEELQKVLQYLVMLPVTIVSIDDIEADDTISYICKNVYNDDNNHITIMSTDRDFLQLIDNRITVWSPTKKILYNKQVFRNEYNMNAENYLIYRILTGDVSDEISGIKGIGLKTLEKYFPSLFNDDKICIMDIINEASETSKKMKIHNSILENKDIIYRNEKLMQLQDVDISLYSKNSIMEQVRRPINRLSKIKFLSYLLQDRFQLTKEPEKWLNDCFFKLDYYASKTHDS